MFSHSEDSPKYSECDTKYGDIQGNTGYTAQAQNVPAQYANNAPWESVRSNVQTVSIENAIKPKNMACWFGFMSNLTAVNNLNNIDTSQIASMSNTFANDTHLNNVNISNWDTSSVTIFSGMFNNCSGLTNFSFGSGFVRNNNAMTTAMFPVNYNCDVPEWYGKTYTINNPVNNYSQYISIDNIRSLAVECSNVNNNTYCSIYDDSKGLITDVGINNGLWTQPTQPPSNFKYLRIHQTSNASLVKVKLTYQN